MAQRQDQKVHLHRHQLAPPIACQTAPNVYRAQLAPPIASMNAPKVQRTSTLSTLSVPYSVGSITSLPHSDSSCTVQREQYWMCSRRTKLEKILMVSIVMLIFVIVGLVIALAILASDDKDSREYCFLRRLFNPLAAPFQPLSLQDNSLGKRDVR